MTKTVCCLLLLCSVLPLGARTKRKNDGRAGKSGQFDYYVFSLSWSPEYCHDHASARQCTVAKPYAFIVHGLWPEYTKGGYPQSCSREPGLVDPSKMLDIMPDPNLIAHEWLKHGTCSGLDPEPYFALIRKAYQKTKIPQKFQAPQEQFTISPKQLAQEFSRANLKLPEKAVQVACPGNYLAEVRICMDKNVKAITCPKPAPCRAQTIKVPPVE